MLGSEVKRYKDTGRSGSTHYQLLQADQAGLDEDRSGEQGGDEEDDGETDGGTRGADLGDVQIFSFPLSGNILNFLLFTIYLCQISEYHQHQNNKKITTKSLS